MPVSPSASSKIHGLSSWTASGSVATIAPFQIAEGQCMPVILSGRASAAVNDLPHNVHVGLFRDLIANPRFLYDRSQGCQDSGKCHYHSRGAKSVICPRWFV